METRLFSISKTTNVTNLTKVIQQVTSKWKTLKQPVYYFKGSWILTYFWHSRWHYFGYISWKVAKPHYLKKSTEVSQSTSSFMSIRLPINSLLKIWKTSVFLTALFSNEKIADIWNFEWSNCWTKVYHI